ncbi:class I SAM-dependent methyltransferase [Fictibacillus barbaricus]|uniref:16S rRNA (Guanine1207-N2)-methyltransferase n=1 Tax=Fictibacillus barbaricus TaxID=182136 RepID=A0ABU1U5U3_9BACL|nr:class I SAM-dependent methyltransferase [Fictibacillus barbaricus]MDR7074802.1 16S rRNA (guanine1207-N2)-methyltransferase [Fictibacillus barbaricus]
MKNHYYSETPGAQSKRETWEFELKGNKFRFTTDAGVFSKKEVDFGSRVLIDSFHAPEVSGDYLDVGCGYGPIGLTLAKEEPDRIVQMVDINERAVELSKWNAQQNKINNVKIKKSYLFSEVQDSEFAAVITNPPIRAGKAVVHQIFEEAHGKLRAGGELWVVIQKKQGAPSAIEKIEELFGQVETVAKKKGYYILRAIKV